ncbi:hypothetical protein EYF80_016977 [Liparis tanakae]|uniref:Uncharacterized protein n=1 Tax=Liparis tanakae TaxID=230148 RepID=A0A4Z2I467_9TELE|nr:hypothetical protein EYF80_016977 [Liparis tanakae]
MNHACHLGLEARKPLPVNAGAAAGLRRSAEAVKAITGEKQRSKMTVLPKTPGEMPRGRKPTRPLTCVSSSSILCRVSRSSAWASASRSLTVISSSCSSLRVFFLLLSFQRPAVRAKWR